MTWQMILAITIPSLIVFLAVYYTFRQYHHQQTRLQLLETKKIKDHITIPLRLQAFERLMLLSERIDFMDLALRMKTPGTNARELQSAMLVAVQQEFEHNLTQQLYISPELWQVLLAAKAKTMDFITLAGKEMDEMSTSEDYTNALFQLVANESSLPSQIAKKAIKTEASLWL